jgi:hypothetical protein
MMCIKLQTLIHLGKHLSLEWYISGGLHVHCQLKTFVYNGATNDHYKQAVFCSLGALASYLFCSRGALFSI